MIKTTSKRKGMLCPMCETRMRDVIRNAAPGADNTAEPSEKKGWFAG